MNNNSSRCCLGESGCCSTEQNNKCPVCGYTGQGVSKITVEHLVNDDNRTMVNGTDYKICMNENCDVVYYSLEMDTKFLKDQVSAHLVQKRCKSQICLLL